MLVLFWINQNDKKVYISVLRSAQPVGSVSPLTRARPRERERGRRGARETARAPAAPAACGPAPPSAALTGRAASATSEGATASPESRLHRDITY